MRKLQSQVHNIVVFLLLHHMSEVSEDLDSFVPDLLYRVVEEVVKEAKHKVRGLLVALLPALVAYKVYYRYKVIDQCDPDVW